MKLTTKMTSTVALAFIGFASVASAAELPIINAGFEDPVLESEPALCGPGGNSCYTASVVGWTLSGGAGGTFNPTHYIPGGAAEGLNTHYSAGSTATQVLSETLREGTYTLTVEIGDRADGVAFSGYEVHLGVDNGTFVSIGTENTLAPVDGFATSTFDVTVIAGDGNLGSPIAIQLVGSGGGQVQFDDVRLDFVATPVNVVVNLQAQRFDKELPGGGSVAMWGFASCDDGFINCVLPTDTNAPGPQINAFAGMDLTVNVRNTLSVPVSVVVPGQLGTGDPVMVDDGTGRNRVRSFTAEISGGADGTYAWTGLRGGSYLYQSGTYPSVQVPMGLYGALIVSEGSGGTAYGSPYQAEAVVLFSEIDPIMNQRVDNAESAAMAMTTECVALADYAQNLTPGYPCTVDYDPAYFLINGGGTATLPAGDPSEIALLRFLNAGLRSHTPSIVGAELRLIAEDGYAYPGMPRVQSAALLAAGKTLDALVTLPNTDVTMSLFDRMPTFSNETLPNGGAIGGVVVGGGSVIEPPTPSGASDDVYAVTEDTNLAVAAPGVRINDDPGLAGPTIATPAANGTVVLATDGGFTYEPNADFSGVDTFIYDAGGNLATVTLNVSFENDAPVANDDGPFVNAIGPNINVAAPGVLGNDQDLDGDALTAVIEGAAPSGLTLNADGSFAYTGGVNTTFSYRADDGTVQSAPVTVTLENNPVANISLTVVDPVGNTITDYRWLVQEEATFHNDPLAPVPAPDQQSLNFHKSYMPVIAQGLSQPDCADPAIDCTGEIPADPAAAISFNDLALDPARHYYVSVLPSDAATGVGHSIGGAQILPGDTAVTVVVNNQEIPTAQISALIFEDHSPTNGVPDAGEVGLGGFQIVLEDAGGRYGMSGGAMSQDAFGAPLVNSLPCAPDTTPGVIVSCPDGSVLIENLPPGKYGVVAVAPPGNWTQTSTIEGSKVIDAWVKAGEPPFFLEFGVAGPHAFFGFVDPTTRTVPTGDGITGSHTITGKVSLLHDPRPPGTPGTSDSDSYVGLSHTRAWVGLNGTAGDGENIQTVQASEDGTFTMSGIPDGTYQLVAWDTYLDQIIAFQVVDLPAQAGDIGNMQVNAWFTRVEHTVFLDVDENGMRGDPEVEIPLAEQAVNLRWRDGTMNQSFPTDLTGFVPFDTIFPFFSWQVFEVDYARFKATGVTTVVDAGGDVTGGAYPGLLNPQQQADGSFSRTETGPVLSQGFQGFPGQTSIMEWGKKPYAAGENGGISGIVFYGSTRGENDPRLTVGDPWEPGIPGATVRLYKEVAMNPDNLTPIAVANAGFEDPVLPADPVNSSYNTTLVGWDLNGTGGTFNPSNYIPGGASEGSNTHWSAGSTATQILTENLSEGNYSLTVDVGDRTDLGFAGYTIRLGVDNSGIFIPLAEDNSFQVPNDGFLTSTVTYTATDADVYLGFPLAIQLTGNGSQVQFDNVQLSHSVTSGLVLVQEVTTDSWDDSLPTGCPGEDPADVFTTETLGTANLTRCYDGWRNWNQVRPAVFDGGYAFNDIPAGKYIVEVVPPPGYELIKEQDLNVGYGDAYGGVSPYAPVAVVLPNGTLVPAVPDGAMVDAAMGADVGLAQPPCVGALHTVPAELSLFPGMEAGFAGADRPLCDRKEVILSDQGQAAADFHLFTATPVAAQFTGLITDDISNETNPASPGFGEKWSPAYLPFSIRDFKGEVVYSGLSDAYGRYNGVLPSTFTANMPIPSGYSPAMMSACLNDAGPNQLPNFDTACYTMQFMPGTTTYLDTPILPRAAFAAGFNAPDCSAPDGTPVVTVVSANGGTGPLVPVAGGTLVIQSMGPGAVVSNPAYEGPMAAPPFNVPTVVRDLGFGALGTVTLGGVALTVDAWSPTEITVTVPGGAATGQLVVTRANGSSTVNTVTVTVSDETATVVSPGGSIQAAVDAAAPGALILVAPGTYDERVIMWKPVRLQGSGSATVINAQMVPVESLQEWRDKLDSVLPQVDLLPGQVDLTTEQGGGITVLASSSGPDRFAINESRIDGFKISGAAGGGGIYVNGYAHNLEIANNYVTGNAGTLHGGIRVGKPFLPEQVPNANGVITYNRNVNIHNNAVTLNGARHFESAGGGVSISTGSTNYTVANNFVCGNFSAGDGAGIGHLGVSNGGTIANNQILFNQSYNQGITQHGGGLFIGGEPGAAPALTLGTGSVVVDGNQIQGNLAGSGHGGGARTQFVNGAEMSVRNPWRIRFINNVIVNNVAAWAGAGMSLQDSINSLIINNTVANNDSTATVGGLVVDNASAAQPAGIVVERHSLGLAGALGAASEGFSNPRMVNNIVLHNRSFHYGLMASGALGVLPELAPATVGACGANPDYWDLGVLGEPQAGATLVLNPRRSILTDATGYHGSNLDDTDGSVGFAAEYCNGARTLSEPWGPILATAAFGEGGNFIDVRYGPLTQQAPGAASPWDYHIGAGSIAENSGNNVNVSTDFDGERRPQGGRVDRGADELFAGDVASVAFSAGEFGIVAEGSTETLTIFATVDGDFPVEFTSSTDPAAPFAKLAGNTCDGQTIAVGASCSYTVTFTPDAAGDFEGSFEVTHDAPGSPQLVDLSGTGRALGTVTADSVSLGSLNTNGAGIEVLNFGTLENGNHLSTITFSITDATMIVGQASTQGGRYSISGEDGGDTCSGMAFSAGDTCSITVEFNANGGGLRLGWLNLPNDGTEDPYRVRLRGR